MNGTIRAYFRASSGWHDGVRVRVLDTVTSPLVSVHEAIHEQIFAETPDGQVVAAFAGALRENLVREDDGDAVRETVTGIFTDSRDAHEVFANYLFIKVLPAAAEIQYLSELHGRYREYYDQLAGLIDENVPHHFYNTQSVGRSPWRCSPPT